MAMHWEKAFLPNRRKYAGEFKTLGGVNGHQFTVSALGLFHSASVTVVICCQIAAQSFCFGLQDAVFIGLSVNSFMEFSNSDVLIPLRDLGGLIVEEPLTRLVCCLHGRLLHMRSLWPAYWRSCGSSIRSSLPHRGYRP